MVPVAVRRNFFGLLHPMSVACLESPTFVLGTSVSHEWDHFE